MDGCMRVIFYLMLWQLVCRQDLLLLKEGTGVYNILWMVGWHYYTLWLLEV